MTRGKKLLILLIVLVLLAGGAVAAIKLIPQEEAETEATEETTEVFFTVDQDSISEIQWEYNDIPFDFKRIGDEWTYVNDPEFPVRASAMNSLTIALSSIETTKTLEDVDAAEDFGLGDSAVTVLVKADKEYEIRFGNTTELSQERYCSIGDGKVYLISTNVTSLFETDLLSMTRMEKIPEMTTANVASFDVLTTDQSYVLENLKAQEVEHEEDTDWYYSNDNSTRLPVDAESAKTLVQSISELTFSTCVCYNATETELTEYGLMEPQTVITIDYYSIDFEDAESDEDSDSSVNVVKTPQKFILTISGEYARIDGSSMIYQIDSSIADTLNAVEYDLIQYSAEEE